MGDHSLPYGFRPDPQADVRRPLIAIQLQTFIQHNFYRIRKIYAVMLLR